MHQLQDLPIDWLGACFDYLTLKELHAASTTSRTCRIAISRTRCTPTLHLVGFRSLYSLMHITSSLLSCRLAHLAAIAYLDGSDSDIMQAMHDGERLLPARLTTFDLQVVSQQPSSDHYTLPLQQLFQAVCSVNLTTLRFWFDAIDPHQVDLQPVSSLPNLTSLQILGFPIELQQHIDVIRQLPRLTSLNTSGGFSAEAFASLLRDPFNLPLKSLKFDTIPFSDEHSLALHSPLLLERFYPAKMTTSSVDFLRMLPCLRAVSLKWDPGAAPTAESVYRGLASLGPRNSVLTLRLWSVHLNSEHVSQFLDLLPNLKELLLSHTPNLNNLSSFSRPGPHRTTLTHLQLNGRGSEAPLLPSEVSHLQSLSVLSSLVLEYLFVFDDKELSMLNSKPPKPNADKLFSPTLKRFSYTPWSKSVTSFPNPDDEVK